MILVRNMGERFDKKCYFHDNIKILILTVILKSVTSQRGKIASDLQKGPFCIKHDINGGRPFVT